MNHATQSKKAAHIESALLNKLALMGQKAFAAAMNVPEYQVSRWKNGLFRQVSLMLAVLNYGIADDEMAELAKRLAGYLTKEKAEQCANTFSAKENKKPIEFRRDYGTK